MLLTGTARRFGSPSRRIPTGPRTHSDPCPSHTPSITPRCATIKLHVQCSVSFRRTQKPAPTDVVTIMPSTRLGRPRRPCKARPTWRRQTHDRMRASAPRSRRPRRLRGRRWHCRRGVGRVSPRPSCQRAPAVQRWIQRGARRTTRSAACQRGLKQCAALCAARGQWSPP
jgi:hypothetical protein